MYYELTDSPSRQDVLQLKANLVAAKNIVAQIVREKDQMTEAQVLARYGFDGATQAQFDNVIDGVATALDDPAVVTVISNIGSAG